eukprot:16255937-Heterocapsa_arctica.AAC.1
MCAIVEAKDAEHHDTTLDKVMTDPSATGALQQHHFMPSLNVHDEAESPASSSSAEHSPVIPWAEFFAKRAP